jgi:hypothetical protein
MAYAPNISRIEDDGTETPMTLSAKACEWKRDGDGGYYVKCQDFRVIKALQRDVDDNTEHNFAYCPYCGGRLTVTANAPVSGVESAAPRRLA